MGPLQSASPSAGSDRADHVVAELHSPARPPPPRRLRGGTTPAPTALSSPPSHPPEDVPVALDAVVRALLRQWRVIALAVAVTAFAAWQLIWLGQPRLRASSLVYVENRDQGAAGAGAFGTAAVDYVSTQAELLTSAPLLARALESPRHDAATLEEMMGGAASPLVWLKEELVVQPNPDDGTIEVSLDSTELEAACTLVNELVEAFRSFHEEQRESSVRTTYDRLVSEEERLQGELEAKLEEQRVYREEEGAVGAGRQLEAVWASWHQLQADRAEAAADAVDAEAKWEAAKEVQSDPTRLRQVMKTLGADDPPATSEAEIRTLREKRSVELGHFTDEHPAVVALEDSIEELVEKDEAAIDAYVTALHTRWQSILVRSEQLGEAVTELEGRASELGAKEAEESALQADVDQLTASLETVQERIEGINMSELEVAPAVFVLEQARPDTSVDVSRRVLRVIAFVLLGLIAGVGIAFMRSLADHRVHRIEEVEYLGATVLATWPFPSRRANERRLAERWSRREGYAESARALCAAVDARLPEAPGQVVLLSDIEFGGPLSDAAAGLAAAFANDGRRTLLIDADSRESSLDGLFDGAPNGPQPYATGIELLDALDVRQAYPDPGQHLNKAVFRRLLDALRGRYDRIVVAATPILESADASVLAPLCNGALLIVRKHRTSRDRIAEALDALGLVGIEVFGAVFCGSLPGRSGRARKRRADRRASDVAGSAPADAVPGTLEDGRLA